MTFKLRIWPAPSPFILEVENMLDFHSWVNAQAINYAWETAPADEEPEFILKEGSVCPVRKGYVA